MEYEANPLSRSQIRELVTSIRNGLKQLCPEIGIEFPLLEFLELILPSLFPDFELEIVDDEELNCYAKAYPSQNRILIRDSVYEGAYRGNGRDRFTIAHEIGHFFLHRDESISFARADVSIPTYKKPEWQANTFAGELLVPVSLIKELSVDEIARECKVSRQVAEIQKKYC